MFARLRFPLLFVACSAIACAASGQPTEPTVPTSPQWIVTPCETWTCASASLVEAAGDRYVVAVPTISSKFPWVVIRRVKAGSFYIPPEAPFVVESYDGMLEASTRFIAIDEDHGPILLTPLDGKKLVVFLREPERRRRTVGAH